MAQCKDFLFFKRKPILGKVIFPIELLYVCNDSENFYSTRVFHNII